MPHMTITRHEAGERFDCVLCGEDEEQGIDVFNPIKKALVPICYQCEADLFQFTGRTLEENRRRAMNMPRHRKV